MGSLENRDLIEPQLWRRLTGRIAQVESVDVAHAERIMDQALAFLQLCATGSTGKSYAPSKAADIGWHTFILFTREYAEFCTRLAGRFIHHSPTDDDGCMGEALAETIAALAARGIVVDESLWLDAGECGGNKCCSCTSR